MSQHLFHKHLIATVSMTNPPRDADTVSAWLLELVDKIDMVVLFGPFVQRCDTEGNEGVTGVVCVETSHCSIHIWDTVDEPFAKLDIYSCKDFEAATIFEHLASFGPKVIDYMVLDRNNGLRVVENQTISVD